MSAATINVQVVYAEAERQHLVQLELAAGATVQDALLAAHFDDVVVQIHANDIPRAIGEQEFQAIYRNDSAHIVTGDVNNTIEHLLRFDIPLDRLRIRARNLEDLFLELTGKELRA